MKRWDPRGAVYNTIAVPWVDVYIAKSNVFGILHPDKNAE
jgi:hypothetical protein